jgi:hypothetical protein
MVLCGMETHTFQTEETMQFKFDTLEAAKAKAMELAGADYLEDDSLQIIHDHRENKFYVEDGTPFLRQFETVLWQL